MSLELHIRYGQNFADLRRISKTQQQNLTLVQHYSRFPHSTSARTPQGRYLVIIGRQLILAPKIWASLSDTNFTI